MQQPSAFHRIYALGYQRVVPVIPPDAEVSPYSTLYKRVGTRQDARGKLPGTKGKHGWASWDWTQHTTDPQDFDRWHAMGAGTGIVTGDGLLAIDADTTDEALAETIRDVVLAHIGVSPIRVGRYPKALYLIRVTDPYAYRRIDFGEPDDFGNYERVEILSDRKFFVAEGVHPKTGKPYTWPRELIPYNDLQLFRPDQVDAMMDALRAALPAASKVQIEGGGETPASQEALRGDIRSVKRAVAAIPNTSKHFPTREAYRDVGYAIKAALPDDEPQAFDIFADWCARWQDGDNDPGVVEADWRRMKPPFRRGASWLYEQAERVGDGSFTSAQVHFEPVAEREPSPFDTQAAQEREQTAADIYPLLSIGDLANRPPPTFLIDRYVPDVSVGFLYSAPGVGKSFLALDMALSIAHGCGDWQGEKVTTTPEKRAVVYIASEGSFDLGNRVKAWHAARGKRPDAPLYVIEATIDFMQPEDIDKLLRSVKSANVSPAMVIVDTVSRAMPGADENAQKDMTLFVRACDQVRETFRCAVLGVHHASKSGDLRGSTVLRGAGDFVIRLEKRTGTIRELEMEKQKAAPDGWTAQFSFGVWQLDDGQSSLVVERVDGAVMPGGGVNPASAVAVLEAMERAWVAGEPWAKSHQSRERFAVRRICMDFGYGREEAEGMLSGWVAMGLVVEAVRDAKTHVKGYQVVEGAISVLKAAKAENGMSELLSEEADVFG